MMRMLLSSFQTGDTRGHQGLESFRIWNPDMFYKEWRSVSQPTLQLSAYLGQASAALSWEKFRWHSSNQRRRKRVAAEPSKAWSVKHDWQCGKQARLMREERKGRGSGGRTANLWWWRSCTAEETLTSCRMGILINMYKMSTNVSVFTHWCDYMKAEYPAFKLTLWTKTKIDL